MRNYRESVRQYQDWVSKHYVSVCFLPCTFLSVVLVILFYLVGDVKNDIHDIWLNFVIDFIFAHSIGTTCYLLWGLWRFTASKVGPIQKHLWGASLQFVGVLIGTAFASLLVSDILDAKFWEVVSQVLILNFFLTSIVLVIGIFYERLRMRLEAAMEKLKEKEVNEQRLLQLKAQAELSSLQAKMNPHFLFNSLNSIASLISFDPKGAEVAVEQLSRVLRYSLRSSLRKSVSLTEELEIVKTYLQIEKIRLGERLNTEFLIRGDVEKVHLPGMFLQPLVENAIKHGIGHQIKGGTVRVIVDVCEDICRIQVQNTGCPWKETKGHEGHGLTNIRERLDLFFEGIYTLHILNDEDVTVEITFPVEKACRIEPSS